MRSAIAIFLVLLCAGSASAERRVALVFGADAYENLRPLKNAVNDARTIELALTKLDFKVYEETNRDLGRMRRALRDFREDAKGADVALVFFAGHGFEIAEENWLLPVDADATSLEALKQSSLPLDEITETVRAVAPVALVLLDACRNDPFGTATTAGRSATPIVSRLPPDAVTPGFSPVAKRENLLIAFAAAPGKTAADGPPDGNSPFTAALAEHLDLAGVQIGSALKLVQQEVYDKTHGDQLPFVEDGLPAMFFAAATSDELPERERLLLAMADISVGVRSQVEQVAAEQNVPLAPLYGALIASGTSDGLGDARTFLLDAARQYRRQQLALTRSAPSDPRVAELRRQATAALNQGEFKAVDGLLEAASLIDEEAANETLTNAVSRLAQAAATRYAKGMAASMDFNFDTAIADFEKSIDLFASVPDTVTLSGGQSQTLIDSQLALGMAYFKSGRFQSALARFQEIEQLREKYPGADVAVMANTPPEVLSLMGKAILQFHRGAAADAEASMLGARKAAGALAGPGGAGKAGEDLLTLVDSLLMIIVMGSGRDEEALQYAEAVSVRLDEAASAAPGDGSVVAFAAATHALKAFGAFRLGRAEQAAGSAVRAEQLLALIAPKVKDEDQGTILQTAFLVLALYHRGTGDVGRAESYLERSIALAEEAVTNGRVYFQVYLELANAYGLLSKLRRAAKDAAGDMVAVQHAAENLAALRQIDASNSFWTKRLFSTYGELAEIARYLGNWKVRRESTIQSLALADDAADALAGMVNPTGLANMHIGVAEAARVCGDQFTADKHARKAVALLEDARKVAGDADSSLLRTLSVAYAASVDLGTADPGNYVKAMEALAPVLRGPASVQADRDWEMELKRKVAVGRSDLVFPPTPPPTCG